MEEGELMAKKKTHEEYINEVTRKNPNIEVIGIYQGTDTAILHKCKLDNHEWMATPHNILRGSGCPKCAIKTNTNISRKTHAKYAEEVAIKNPNIKVVGEYVNAITPILHRCNIDGYEWYARPANILFGKGCPKCAGTLKKTTEIYINELDVINPNVDILEEYINAKTPILHKCRIDGHKWKAAPSNILSGFGCPVCNESHGEKLISRWLEEHDIKYIPQYTFNNCKYKNVLPFDFYLSNYNICIEYDGKQHFEPVDFAGKGEEWAKQQFDVVKRHDAIKTQYCQENNIKLLRIPYFKNIEEELNQFFIHLI